MLDATDVANGDSIESAALQRGGGVGPQIGVGGDDASVTDAEIFDSSGSSGEGWGGVDAKAVDRNRAERRLAYREESGELRRRDLNGQRAFGVRVRVDGRPRIRPSSRFRPRPDGGDEVDDLFQHRRLPLDLALVQLNAKTSLRTRRVPLEQKTNLAHVTSKRA